MLALRWLRESRWDHQHGVCSKWVRAKNTAKVSWLISPVGPRAKHLPSWVFLFILTRVILLDLRWAVFWDFFFQNPSFTWTIHQQPMACLMPQHTFVGALHLILSMKLQVPEFGVTNTELWKCSWQNPLATSLPSFSLSPLLLDTLMQLRCSNSCVRNMDHWEGSFFQLPLSQGLGRSTFWVFTDTYLNTSFILGRSWDIDTIFIFLMF